MERCEKRPRSPRIKEADLGATDGPEMLKFLVHNLAYVTNAMRESIQGVG